jgi:hypothetical protein
VAGDHVPTQFHLVILSYVSFGHYNLWEICSKELFIQLAFFVLHSVKYRLGVQIPEGGKNFVFQIAQTGSWAHPACNLVCTGGKTAGARF